jgi:hypothetical protein
MDLKERAERLREQGRPPWRARWWCMGQGACLAVCVSRPSLSYFLRLLEAALHFRQGAAALGALLVGLVQGMDDLLDAGAAQVYSLPESAKLSGVGPKASLRAAARVDSQVRRLLNHGARLSAGHLAARVTDCFMPNRSPSRAPHLSAAVSDPIIDSASG